MTATDKQIKFMRSLKIDIPEGCSKVRARELIEQSLDKTDAPVEKVAQPKVGNGAMFTSYAKDIFVAITAEGLTDVDGNKISAERVMEESIRLVKQAKAAFE